MNMRTRWLPSRQFTLVLTSIVIVSIFVGFAYWYKPKKEQLGENMTVSHKTPDRPIIGTQDSDGDGLQDWEEGLWRTDAHNPDTDGDGTGDGQEVAENRNPTIAGPDDSTVIETTNGDTSSSDQEDLSHTEIVLNTLVSRYATLAQAGIPVTSEQITKMADSLVQQKPNSPTPKYYSQTDIHVTLENSTTAVRNYGNSMGSVFASQSDDTNNELLVLGSFGQTGNLEKLDELREVVQNYNNIISSLLIIPVPPRFAATHVALLNTLSAVSANLEGMVENSDDALAVLILLRDYTRTSASFVSTFQNLREQLLNEGIVFSSSENGFVITNKEMLGT